MKEYSLIFCHILTDYGCRPSRKAMDGRASVARSPVSRYIHSEHAGIVRQALHHLPDFWKQIALTRLYEMLKPGGKLFLADLVFCFKADDYHENIERWLGKMGELGGK